MPRRTIILRPSCNALLIALLVTVPAVCIGGCATGDRVSARTNPAGSAVVESSTEPRGEVGGAVTASLAVLREPWDFHGAPGLILTTDNYRIHTTGDEAWMHEYAAAFCEQALIHYRTAFTALPAPTRRLDVFLFAQREEWQTRTREVMKEHADLYLNLGRGGYSTRGTAVLYDIGFNDTFAILAHEGWHQYTQTTFKHALPTWLEEGIATWMEGRRQTPGDEVAFDAWQNRQRFETLGRALWRNRLIPLKDLVDRSPQQFLEDDDGGLLTYYAQVWALTHFVMTGEGGRYRAGMERALRDAADGVLVGNVMSALADAHIPPGQRRRMAQSAYGPGVIFAYFNASFAEFAEQYVAFIEEIVRDRQYRPTFRRRGRGDDQPPPDSPEPDA